MIIIIILLFAAVFMFVYAIGTFISLQIFFCQQRNTNIYGTSIFTTSDSQNGSSRDVLHDDTDTAMA